MKVIVQRESLCGKIDDTKNQPWPGTVAENIRTFEGLDYIYCDWTMEVEKFADLEQFYAEGHEFIVSPMMDGTTVIEILDGPAPKSVQDTTTVI